MKINKFANYIIYIFITLVSFYQLVPFSFLDELLLLFLFCSLFIPNVKEAIIYIFKHKVNIIFLLFIIFCFITTMLSGVPLFAFVKEFHFTIKIPLFFFVFYQFRVTNFELKKYLIHYVRCTFISILYIYFYQIFYIFNPLEIGLKRRSIDALGRMSGLSGHPIWMGMILLCSIIIINEFDLVDKQKNKKKYYFTMSLMFTTLFLTQSRFPLALLFVYLVVKLGLKLSLNLLKKSIISILACLVLLSPVIINFASSFIESEMSSVRMQSIITIPNAIYNYPLGSGIGTFGGESSVQFDNDLYELLEIDRPTGKYEYNSGNYFESTFVQRLVELGMVGLVLFYLTFLYPLSYAKKENLMQMIILIFFACNTFINVGYELHFVLIGALCGSNLLYKKI